MYSSSVTSIDVPKVFGNPKTFSEKGFWQEREGGALAYIKKFSEENLT